MPAIQVKNVPEDLHDALRARAAEAGTTQGEYLLELIRRDLRRPRLQAWLDDVEARRTAAGVAGERLTGGSAAESVRAARDERAAELGAAVDHRR